MEGLRARYQELLEANGLLGYVEQLEEAFADSVGQLKRSLDLAHSQDAAELSDPKTLARLALDFYQSRFCELKLPELTKEIYCAPFPTPTFNAEIRDEGKDGYLVLICGGLHYIVTTAIDAVVLSAPSHVEHGEPMRPLMSYEEAAKGLASVLKGFHKPVPNPVGLPRVESEIMWMTMVLYSAVDFVVVHEYAHASLGHLGVLRDRLILTPGGNVPVNGKSVSQEWSADRYATSFFLQRYMGLSEYWEEPGSGALLTGPMVFLMLASWFEHLFPPEQITHPPAGQRLMALRMAFDGKVGRTRGYRVAWNFASHLERLGAMAGLIDRPMFAQDSPG